MFATLFVATPANQKVTEFGREPGTLVLENYPRREIGADYSDREPGWLEMTA